LRYAAVFHAVGAERETLRGRLEPGLRIPFARIEKEFFRTGVIAILEQGIANGKRGHRAQRALREMIEQFAERCRHCRFL